MNDRKPQAGSLTAVMALVCALGVAVLLVAAGSANASPRPSPLRSAAMRVLPGSPGPQPFADPLLQPRRRPAAAAISPAAIAYYARRYRVSSPNARRRLVTQARGLNLPSLLARHLGRNFRALWFDNRHGTWAIEVAHGASARAVHALMSARGLGHAYRLMRISRASPRLSTAGRAVARRLARIAPSGRVAVGVGPGRLEIMVSSALSSAARARARAALDDAAPTRFSVVKPRLLHATPNATCTFSSCDTLAAGIGWSDALRSCSTGFVVKTPEDPSWYMLTAGHCITVGQQWWICNQQHTSCPYAGEEVAGRYGGANGDAGLLRIDAGWPIYAGYVDRATATLAPVRAWWSGSVPVNTVICLDGGDTDATTCGTVTANDTTVSYGNTILTGMIQVTGACVHDGDSGGPWTMASQGIAVGIHSGSTPSPNGCGNPAYVEPIGRAISDFNATVYGNP